MFRFAQHDSVIYEIVVRQKSLATACSKSNRALSSRLHSDHLRPDYSDAEYVYVVGARPAIPCRPCVRFVQAMASKRPVSRPVAGRLGFWVWVPLLHVLRTAWLLCRRVVSFPSRLRLRPRN